MAIRMLPLAFLLSLPACAVKSPQYQALDEAYRQGEPELDRFFLDWKEQLPPFTMEERASLAAPIQSVYEVFEAFYAPDQLASVGWGRDKYVKLPYYLVQNEINYTVVDQILEEGDWEYGKRQEVASGTIADFSPLLDAGQQKTIYLNKVYRDALWKFVGGKATRRNQAARSSWA